MYLGLIFWCRNRMRKNVEQKIISAFSLEPQELLLLSSMYDVGQLVVHKRVAGV
jgi:hypothetical protein